MYEYLGGNHWITISTLKCPPAVVCVYDSLHYQLSPSMKKTVADLLQTKKEHNIIQYINTQVQEGGSDCGLFAIATATTLCHGEDPVDLEYDQSLMRSHLLKAFSPSVIHAPCSVSLQRQQERGRNAAFFTDSVLQCIAAANYQTMGGR